VVGVYIYQLVVEKNAKNMHAAFQVQDQQIFRYKIRSFSSSRSVVRCLGNQKTNKISAQTVATARIAPKVCHGQPPTFGSQSSKFQPNRFTFSGIIAGHVKAVKTRLKVNPILREAIASRRVTTITSATATVYI